jgi:phage terminase large subunit-like protein
MSKEQFYRFEPYYNRSNGSPSWQWEFLLAADKYKGRVALGGNRIGKTEIGAYEAVLAITGQHPVKHYPSHGTGWIVGLDNAMIRDTDRPKFEKLLPSRFKTKFYKQDNIWICNSDDREWKIVFKSTEMGIDKFQAANINWAWVDEEPKNTDMWPELEARLVDANGNWWMTATPVRGTAWLKSLSERDGVFKTFAGMRENPHIPLEAVEDFAATLTDDEKDVRIEGKYIIFGGNPVFDRRILREMMEQLGRETIAVETGILQGAA